MCPKDLSQYLRCDRNHSCYNGSHIKVCGRSILPQRHIVNKSVTSFLIENKPFSFNTFRFNFNNMLMTRAIFFLLKLLWLHELDFGNYWLNLQIVMDSMRLYHPKQYSDNILFDCIEIHNLLYYCLSAIKRYEYNMVNCHTWH